MKRLSNQGNSLSNSLVQYNLNSRSPSPWRSLTSKSFKHAGGRKATSHDVNLIGWLFFSALGFYIMDCCAPASVPAPKNDSFWPLYMQVRSMYWLFYCLCEKNKKQKRGQYMVYKWVISDLGVAWAVYWSDTTLNMQTESRRGFNLLNQWGPATKVKAVLAGGDFPFHKPLMWRISQSQTLLFFIIRDSEHWALWWPLICVLGSQ